MNMVWNGIDLINRLDIQRMAKFDIGRKLMTLNI